MVRSKLCARTVPTDRRLCPGRGPPGRDARAITQREEQVRCCSLIYKLPVLWMSGASARYSCLRTPVETSTSPCVRMDPIGQVSARSAKTTTGGSILPFKIEPASLGFDFEKRTTLQVFPLKNERQAFVFGKNNDRSGTFDKVIETKNKKLNQHFSGSGYSTPKVSTVTFFMTWGVRGRSL